MTRHFASKLGLFLLLAIAASAQSAPSAGVSPQEVVTRWRQAMHAGPDRKPVTAALTTTSTEDGVTGQVEEWFTSTDAYRAVVTREFDRAEFVLRGPLRQRRDWNGFVREVEGQELSRLRTSVFESRALVFGPPREMPPAQVTESDDHKFYLLKVEVPGGTALTWYVDRSTGLPAKSVRPGEDSEITTVYEDWQEMGGVLTPARGQVSETDKPDYQWQRNSLKLSPGGLRIRFAALPPGPSDVHMDAVVPPIPFDFDSAHIIFKMSLNGREPSWWILDTGADQEVINESRLAEYGIRPYAKTITTGGGGSAQYSYAAGATFTLPGVELRNQHVAVIDQTGLERALGLPLGGILGFDFITAS